MSVPQFGQSPSSHEKHTRRRKNIYQQQYHPDLNIFERLDIASERTLSPRRARTVTFELFPTPINVTQEYEPEFVPEVEVEQAEETLEPESEAAIETEEVEEPTRVRRIILDAPTNVAKVSRDFRILPEHGVGQGSLHMKAIGNLEAIQLLKKLEEESRAPSYEEKKVLVRYCGWGALANVFEYGWNVRPEYKEIAKQLTALLTDDEWKAARATTPNAHFTSPQVVLAIWNALQHMGVQKGVEVLEPAMGVGHFFGLMPDDLQGGHRTGVELDPITARIAQQLYPDTTIRAQGFEETDFPDSYFDVIVGNVPFGDYGVHDPSIKQRWLKSSIHDYFPVKALSKLREGGILAFITSRYTMDKKDSVIRQYIASQANLLGAIRLPNTAFKGNAGTEVTTDIIFLQKCTTGVLTTKIQQSAWTNTGTIQLPDSGGTMIDVPVNQYYINHPEMLLGEHTLKGTMYRGNELTLEGHVTDEGLARIIALLPEDVYVSRTAPPSRVQKKQQESISAQDFVGSSVKDGAYTEVGGKFFIRNGAMLDTISLPSGQQVRIHGLIQIRDAVREVFRTQLDDCSEEVIIACRHTLNGVYNLFVAKHGPISSKENTRAFAGDPDLPLLLSLENYDTERRVATKTAIFTKRTIEKFRPVERVETAAEALAITLNETGTIDWTRIAQLTDADTAECQLELDGQVFLNPVGSIWETADEYLSGNVRAKLKTARSAALLNPVYEGNVTALEAVQPKDLLPGDINPRLGASWIPTGDIAAFVRTLLDVPDGIIIQHVPKMASWRVELEWYAQHSVGNTTTWGTDRLEAGDLIEQSLNGKIPMVYDYYENDKRVLDKEATIAAQEMQQKIADKFRVWLWEDAERAERLARHYNDTMNNTRLRTYNGSHLTFPGLSRTGLRNNDLDRHQKDAVWRVLQNKSTGLFHCVGAGKTLEYICACMELKRLGLVSKPMIAVPNHLVDQWGTAFITAYPTANIFVAGKEAFEKGNRQKAMARIATGTYDAIIISHKSFELLPVTSETYHRFVDQEIDDLTDAKEEAKKENGDSRSIVKEIERAIKRLETRIADRAKRESKDNGVTFEQLGVDAILVDEADLYKNLGFVTKMARIAGLSNTESNRALDMYMKICYVRDIGGRIVKATGTPVSNTMAEMFTLMRYLAPDVLEAAGIAHFDAWAANFGEAVTALEIAPDGSGYRMHTRFARFVNLPELLTMFRTFADVQTASMLNLPTPRLKGGKTINEVLPCSPELKDFVATLVARAEKCHGGMDPRIDNMLKVVGDGRKAALDMRLVDHRIVEIATETKVGRATERIVSIWAETMENRSTQLVFCDLSTPTNEKFNVYHELKRLLLARGIPESEIAFIHSADTDTRKRDLFEKVNAGRVRVLLGSTEKMGAGMNVQRRLVALHHLDAPWRPRDIEQREGRILRQGNENEEVSIYRYVTEGSFDAYMWQTLETKARFIAQIMSGETSVRTAEDLENGSLSYAEIKALASGNKIVMEKVKVDMDVRRYDTLRAEHANKQYQIAQELRFIPKRITNLKEEIAAMQEDITLRDSHADEEFSILIGDETFSGKGVREQAGEALLKLVMQKRGDTDLRTYGAYKGFTIQARDSRYESEEGTQLMYKPELFLKGVRGTHESNLNPHNAFGTISSIGMMLANLDLHCNERTEELARREKEMHDFQGQMHQPFEHAEKLEALLREQERINDLLDLDKHEKQLADAAASSSSLSEEEAA